MKYYRKHKFWVPLVVVLLILPFLDISQRSTAKQKLLEHYQVPLSTFCSAGGAKALPPIVKLSPGIFGYNFKIEISEKKLVKGSISLAGAIHEKATERLECALQ